MKKPKLPANPSKTWPGGFALPPPNSAYRISAAAGYVVSGGLDLWMLRPGATSFLKGPLPNGEGDVFALAVEPRRPSRFAVAGLDCVSIIEGEHLSTTSFESSMGEPGCMAWGWTADGKTSALFILFEGGAFVRLVPGSVAVEVLGDERPVLAMATDENGALVSASFDEENWEVEVILEVRRTNQLVTRRISAPDTMFGMTIAVADTAVAMSFDFGPSFIAREWDAPFVEVEGLRGGSPIAFQGTAKDAAIFGVAGGAERVESERGESAVESMVRIDAAGEVTCLAEVDAEGTNPPRIHGFAWDASRSTLWAAAGEAGILWATENGKRVPFGPGAVS